MTLSEVPTVAALMRFREPANPARQALSFELRQDATRSPRSTLGAEPRLPSAIMAEVESALVGLTDTTNADLKAAVKGVLEQTEDGTVDPAKLKKAIQRVQFIVSKVTKKGAAQVAAVNLQKVDKFNARDVQRTIGIAVPEYSSAIGEKWRREHIAKIVSLGEVPKLRMVGLLREASQKQTRVETLKKQIENEFGVNERRARLIARDQILNLNAKLRRDRHERAGITQYKWRVIDGAARSNHKALDGKIFSYDDPPKGGGTGPDDEGNPGDGIGCRCQDIPIVPAAVKQKAAEGEKPDRVAQARAKAKKVATAPVPAKARLPKRSQPERRPSELEARRAQEEARKKAELKNAEAESKRARELRRQLAKAEAATRKAAQQQAPPAPAAALENTPVRSIKPLGGGVNPSFKVETETGPAVWKPVENDSSSATFIGAKDMAIREAAIYDVAKAVGLDFVPETVLREVDGKLGSMQRFVDGGKTVNTAAERFTEKALLELEQRDGKRVTLLDTLLANPDRHGDNLMVVDVGGKLEYRTIDNGLGFAKGYPGRFRYYGGKWREEFEEIRPFVDFGPDEHKIVKGMDLETTLQGMKAKGVDRAGAEGFAGRATALRKDPKALLKTIEAVKDDSEEIHEATRVWLGGGWEDGLSAEERASLKAMVDRAYR